MTTLTGDTILVTGNSGTGVETIAAGQTTIDGGSVTTQGASASSIYVSDAGSSVTTRDGAAIAATGDHSTGVFVTNGGTAALNSGTVTSSGIDFGALSATGVGPQ